MSKNKHIMLQDFVILYATVPFNLHSKCVFVSKKALNPTRRTDNVNHATKNQKSAPRVFNNNKAQLRFFVGVFTVVMHVTITVILAVRY